MKTLKKDLFGPVHKKMGENAHFCPTFSILE